METRGPRRATRGSPQGIRVGMDSTTADPPEERSPMTPRRVGIMGFRRTGSLRRQHVRRWALWAGLSVGWLLPTAGCQVEYAGMTLPSGKYMHDDVQYFAPGPDFPWANTQAATQRARMQAMGIEPPPGVAGAPGSVPVVPGAIMPIQNQMG